MIRFVLSTLALIASIVSVILFEGGSLPSYFVVSAFLIVALIPLFAVLAVWSLKDWGRAWRDAFAAGAGASSAAVSAKLWSFYEKSNYAAGLVGSLLGIITILSRLNDPSRLGASLAVALTAPTYAILLGLVARILKARVENIARP